MAKKKSSSTKSKPWTIKRIESLSSADLVTMSKMELAKLVTAYQKQFRKRTNEFKKAGLFSHAEDQLRRSFEGREVSTLNKETGEFEKKTIIPKIKHIYAKIFKGKRTEENIRFDRNTLLWYANLMQDFFSPAPEGYYRTNTVEGIRKLNYEEDARLFGLDEEGRLRNQFSNEEERRAFWKLYDEVMNAYSSDWAAWGYVKVINGLAQYWENNLRDKDLITQLNDAYTLLKGRRPTLEDFDENYIGSSSTKTKSQKNHAQNFQKYLQKFGDTMLKNNANRDDLVNQSQNVLSDGTPIIGDGYLSGTWNDDLWDKL